MKVHSRQQVMYSLDIGSSYDLFDSGHPAMVYVAEAVSKVTGGCTLIDSVGYWADVERANKESYDEFSLGCEGNVQLQVKAEPHKENKIERVIVEAITEMSQKYPELGINWVCGHKVTRDGLTVAFNFSTKENVIHTNMAVVSGISVRS